MKTCIFSLFLIFFLVISGYQNIPKAHAEENPCLTCHVKLQQPAKYVHAVLKTGCEVCHTKEEGKNHPDDKKSMKLTQNMPNLCYNCHEASKFKGVVVHAPIMGGMCTSCHDPHQSDNPKILKEPIPAVCYTCHDKTKFTKKYVHKVINVIGCGTCHSPHASDNPALLPSSKTEVCISCHKSQASGSHVVAIPGPSRRLHPIKGVKDPSTLKWIQAPDPKNPKRMIEIPDPNVPGEELTCVSCHDPHSSDYHKLFTAERICLKCHKF